MGSILRYMLRPNSKKNKLGTTVCEKFPFISVSPYLEVCCSCHGERLVEIKWPTTVIGKIPNSEIYSTHIEQQNDSSYLKK